MINSVPDKLWTAADVLSLLALFTGPSFVVAWVVWLIWFKGTRLTSRSAAVICAVAAICSIGGAWHMYAPALYYLVFVPPNERLYWIGWMAATGALVTSVAALVNRFATRDHAKQSRAC